MRVTTNNEGAADHGQTRLKQARVNGVNSKTNSGGCHDPFHPRSSPPSLAALAILAATAVPASAPATAKSNFDGQWSVLIVTQKGTCDRAYRYPVKIDNGSVGYAGDASFTVSGKVGDNGAVTVMVSRGSQSAKRPGPAVGDRRFGHVDRRLGRVLGHLDGRAPHLVSPQNSTQISEPGASRRGFLRLVLRGGPRG